MAEVSLGFLKRNVDAGSHIVMFYEKEDELLGALSKFFVAGLKNNEFCVFLYPKEDIAKKIKGEIEKKIDLFKYVEEKRIQFTHYKKFYFKNNHFNKENAYKLIKNMLDYIVIKGFDLIRGASDMSWVSDKFFKKVLDFESGVTEKFSESKVLFICAYPVKNLPAASLIDIIQSHVLLIYKKGNKWCISETVERKILKNKIDGLEKFYRTAIKRELELIKLKKKLKNHGMKA